MEADQHYPAALALATAVVTLLSACNGSGTDGGFISNEEASSSTGAEIRQTDRWFTDTQGRVVTLHGVNITFPEKPPKTDMAALYRDDAAFLASQGFNVVRLATFVSGYLPQPGIYDNDYLDSVKSLVDTLTAAGLYVIVDAHQDLYTHKYYGRGMPEWMAVDNGLPVQPDTGNLFLNYAAGLAVQQAFDNFWNNANGPDGVPLQTTYGRALQQLVLRTHDNPRVLGYELMNEPFPGVQFPTCATPAGCPLFDQLSLTPFNRRIAAMLREADKSKIIFYEPNVTFDFGANTWLGDIDDNNAALSFHDYCLGNQFGQFPVDNSEICEPVGERPQFQYALEHANHYHKSLILTEFGHFTAPVNADTSDVVIRMARIADDNMVPWTYWHYDGVASYTLVKDATKAPAGDNFYPKIVDAVVRVYPRAIAGTPQSWSYNADTKIFDLVYSTQRVDGKGVFSAGSVTEIYIPLLHYPGSYRVTADNGTIAPITDAQIVHVTANSAASQVHIHIEPQP